MEIFSVFSSDKLLIDSLIDFFLKNSEVKFSGRDNDTIYFESIEDDSLIFYVHFNTDFDEEMELNFDKEEKQFIKHFLESEEVFMLDISYKDSSYLYQLLSDFVRSWRTTYNDKRMPIMFHDPFNGFVEISG